VPSGDRVAALREMHRVLRPGGRILLADLRAQPSGRRLDRLFSGPARRARRHHALPDLTELVAQSGLTLTGSGDRWPGLHYVQARRG
jgi:ubiquinone/menaquinone biosynthesis C-methylase UbiE